MAELARLAELPKISSASRSSIISALLKMVGQCQTVPESVADVVERYSSSRDVQLQQVGAILSWMKRSSQRTNLISPPMLSQRCKEFLALCRNMGSIKQVLPLDGSCEDVEVDPHLAFLNSYVAEALQKGAKKYQRDYSWDLVSERAGSVEKGLRLEAYEAPKRRSETLQVAPTAGSAAGIADASSGKPGGGATEWPGSTSKPALPEFGGIAKPAGISAADTTSAAAAPG